MCFCWFWRSSLFFSKWLSGKQWSSSLADNETVKVSSQKRNWASPKHLTTWQKFMQRLNDCMVMHLKGNYWHFEFSKCVFLVIQFPSLFKGSWWAQCCHGAWKFSTEKSKRTYGKSKWSNNAEKGNQWSFLPSYDIRSTVLSNKTLNLQINV